MALCETQRRDPELFPSPGRQWGQPWGKDVHSQAASPWGKAGAALQNDFADDFAPTLAFQGTGLGHAPSALRSPVVLCSPTK